MEFIIPILVGVVIIVIGISNMKGNINSLHSYHRNRVAEEDRAVFGKLVGFGTVLCGAGLVLFGAFSYVGGLFSLPLVAVVGAGALVVCLCIGLGISFYAMIKYNKGIF